MHRAASASDVLDDDPTVAVMTSSRDYGQDVLFRQVSYLWEPEKLVGSSLAARVTPMVPSPNLFETGGIRMHVDSFAIRSIVVFGFVLSLGNPALLPSLHAEESGTIAHSEQYFPDEVGNRWTYRGQISEGPLQTIDLKVFSNVSSVTGTKAIKGLKVTVFHDTNPGNHGPSDSFYRRDVVGIVYYGSDPGTPLEKQLIPYQIIRFPMKVGTSFQQFDRSGLDFGTDMDRDGSALALHGHPAGVFRFG